MKPSVVWLEFQDCAGDTESTLRATKPTLAQLVLDIISLEYHETLMAAAGRQSEKSLADVVKNQKGKYLTVVEGAIPLKDGGIYCTVGGRAAVDIAREVCGNAFATIAVGNCATFGGIAAAHPNPTGAVGVQEAVTGNHAGQSSRLSHECGEFDCHHCPLPDLWILSRGGQSPSSAFCLREEDPRQLRKTGPFRCRPVCQELGG